MREYLRKFFDYQDQLFWGKDIDDTDKRIDMWLKSDECEALTIPRVSNTEGECCPKCGSYEIDSTHSDKQHDCFNCGYDWAT